MWLVLVSDRHRTSDESTARLIASGMASAGMDVTAEYVEDSPGDWRWCVVGRGLTEQQYQRIRTARAAWAEIGGFEFELPPNTVGADQILRRMRG